MLLYQFKKVALSCYYFVVLLLLLSPVESARFTQVPPSVLYVLSGQNASFVWDYYVADRDNDFSSTSPKWSFYPPSGSEQIIAVEDKFDPVEKWKWKISPTTCPSRLLNPTRVSKESKATLVISNVTTVDNGVYGCSLSLRSSSDIISKVQLIVTVPPRFNAKPPLTKNIAEGQDLSLSCTAIGSPTPNITWVQIVGNIRVIKSTGTGSATLSIRNIRRDQNGTYECQAKNNLNKNQPVSAQTVVTIYYKPAIDVLKSSLVSKSWNGKRIRLKCFAIGLPTPRISWYKPTNQQITSGVEILPGGSELTITTTLDQGDYGQYKCRATNSVGSDEHAINVTQLFSPGPVDIRITDIEASSISLRWAKPAIDAVTSYLVEISTKPPISIVNTYVVITGLKKNTKYTVKVYAKNNVGYGMVSTKVITTKEQGKPSVPLLSATLLQSTGSQLSVSFKWTKPDDNGEMITKYTIYMKDVTSQHDWTKIKDILKLSNLEYTITKNIEYGKTYKFIVTAWNKYGESVKDDWNVKIVNTTADKATHISEKAVSSSTHETSKFSSTVVGVIIAILVISLGLNILLVFLFLRKVKLNGEKENTNNQLRKTPHKVTKDEIYENDLEMEDTTLPDVKESSAQQPSRHQIPEYETIQRLNEEEKHQATPFTSSGLRHYQELNLPQSSLSKQEGQRTTYEPLRTTSMKPRTTQQNDNEPQPSYEPLGLRNQSSDYQSLQTNNRESVI